MKKINYLFAIIATVFVLGMTSCDPNEVTPDPTVDGLTIQDIDGFWEFVSVEYTYASNSNVYTSCEEINTLRSLTNLTKYAALEFDVNSTTNTISIDEYARTSDCGTDIVVEDVPVTILSNENSFIVNDSGREFKFEVLSIEKVDGFNIYIAEVKLVYSTDTNDFEGAIYTLQNE